MRICVTYEDMIAAINDIDNGEIVEWEAEDGTIVELVPVPED